MPQKAFTADLPHPATRLRVEYDREQGFFRSFVVQIEYHITAPQNGPNGYHPVARFDHDIAGSHDVRFEGLHMDILDPGPHKVRVLWNFPPKPLDQYLGYAEQYLRTHHDRLVNDFEKRNGL